MKPQEKKERKIIEEINKQMWKQRKTRRHKEMNIRRRERKVEGAGKK